MKKKHISIAILLCWLCACIYAENAVRAESQHNWKTFDVNSLLSLHLRSAGLRLPSDRNTAFARIKAEAPHALKNSYLALQIDSSHKLGDYLAAGHFSLNDIVAIIQDSAQDSAHISGDLETAYVRHRVAMPKIAELFIQHKTPHTPTAQAEHTVSKAYTGIIIDARGNLPVHGEYVHAPLVPSLFPKIWNTEMELIYEKNMVDPSVARSIGIVQFDSTLDESAYRRRVGTNPLRIIARGVFGAYKTDPILSVSDASQILALPENRALLAEGKIVILCDNAVLTPDRLPAPDESFYFAYHDIEKMLQDKKPGKPEVGADREIKFLLYDIRFVADEAIILPDETWKLDAVAEALLSLGSNVNFLIEGHTADLNRPENELILSIERAEKIAAELSLRGISAERLSTAGYGSTRPLAPSDTSENKAKNRRVEITVLGN